MAVVSDTVAVHDDATPTATDAGEHDTAVPDERFVTVIPLDLELPECS